MSVTIGDNWKLSCNKRVATLAVQIQSLPQTNELNSSNARRVQTRCRALTKPSAALLSCSHICQWAYFHNDKSLLHNSKSTHSFPSWTHKRKHNATPFEPACLIFSSIPSWLTTALYRSDNVQWSAVAYLDDSTAPIQTIWLPNEDNTSVSRVWPSRLLGNKACIVLDTTPNVDKFVFVLVNLAREPPTPKRENLFARRFLRVQVPGKSDKELGRTLQDNFSYTRVTGSTQKQTSG